MAISFIGSQSGNASNGGNILLDLSGLGMQEGDLVIAALNIPSATDFDMTKFISSPGWTPLCDLFSDDNQRSSLGVFAKFMGATPDASVTLTGNAAGLTEGPSAVAMVFRGVDKTRPFDVLPTTATGINSVLANPPSITPSGASGVWTVAIGAGGHTDSATQTYGAPSGYATNFVTIAGNDTNDSVIGMGYNSSPSNPENPGAFTYSTSDNTLYSWCAITLALRPIETDGIFLVGSASGTSVNGGDITLTLPTCLENDLVIVAANIPRNANIDVQMSTSGYTEVADLFADDANDTNLGVFYKKMGASPDTTAVVVGGADASDGCSAVALVFRNVDTTTPMDVSATTNTGVNSGNADPPSINQADPDAVIVVAGGSGGTPGYIFPKNYIGVSAVETADTRDSLVGLAYAASHLVSEPEDPAAFNEMASAAGSAPVTDTADSWCAVTMALRLAPLDSTGSAASVIPATTQTASGDVIVDGPAASVIPAVTQAAVGIDPSVTMPNWIVECAFTTDPGDESPVWENISPWVKFFEFDRGTNHELDQPQTGTGKLVLNNEDRRFDPTYEDGPYFPDVLPMRRIRIRGGFQGTTYDEFYGHAEEWRQEFPEDGALQQVTVPLSDGFLWLALPSAEGSYAQELTGTRVDNILDAVDWPAADRDVDPGQSLVAAVDLESSDKALSHLLEVHTAELGLMYVARTGKFTFVDRHAFIAEPTDFTVPWGDVDGEHRYVDIEMPYGHENIYNDVRVTRTGGTEQQSTDATSRTKFGPRTLPRTVILATDNEAADQSAYLLSRFKDPALRVSDMEIAVMRDTAQVAQVLAGEIGNKHQVRRRHPATPSEPIEQNIYIVGIHMWADAESGEWGAAWRLAPLVSEQAWILDDEDFSVLDDTTRLAY